jgi:hypothetical protein
VGGTAGVIAELLLTIKSALAVDGSSIADGVIPVFTPVPFAVSNPVDRSMV